jgi:myo-inositol-1(or 4)-monophosphatase
MDTTTKKQATAVNFQEEVAELHTLFRVLGEEAVMMRNAGKLAEKERAYFGDIATEADLLIEKEIVKRIQARYPDHCVNGEQSGPSKPEGSLCEYEWIVNPIDGTTNFSKGLTFFSIAVGLLHAGIPVMGTVYFPELSRFIYAVKDEGVYDNGKPLTVFKRPAVQEMKYALIATATSRKNAERSAILRAIRLGSQNMINTGAMTYNCVLLAERKIDAVIHTDATPFHIAAVMPILAEAGCTISGFEKEMPDLGGERTQVIFAENRQLHQDIRNKILPQWKAIQEA